MMAEPNKEQQDVSSPPLPDPQALSRDATSLLSAKPTDEPVSFEKTDDAPSVAPKDDASSKIFESIAQSQKASEDISKRQISAIEKNQETTKGMLAQREKESKPFIDAAMQAINTPPPPRPKLAPPPTVPQMQGTVNQWMGAAFIFSALAGAMVRKNSTAALSAMGGILNGFAEGRTQAVEEGFKQWDRDNKRALELNENKLKEYENAIADRNRPIVQAQEALKFIAAKWQDPLMMQAKDFDTQMSLLDRQRESQNNSINAAKGIVDLATKLRTLQTDPTKVENSADLIGQGKMAPLSGYALRTEYGQQVMSRVAEKYPQYDAAKGWYGKVAGARTTGAAAPKALSATLTQLEKSRHAVAAFEETAVLNGRVLVELAKKVDKTGIPVFERWIRAGRQAGGDVEVAKFNAQLRSYATEVAKIQTNPNLTGQLTDSARHEIDSFLGSGTSYKQLEGVTNLLEQDFKRRIGPIDKQIALVKQQLQSLGGQTGKPQQPDNNSAQPDPLGIR